MIKERVSKKATLIAAMVWCILLLVNAWIFLHRSEGYNYRRLATYDELYVPSEKQHIKKLYFKSDSAIIEMAKPLYAQAWRFVRDDSIVNQALVNGHRVAIPLKKGIHTYHFVASGMNQPAFECALDFVCESNGGPSHCRNEWLYCSLPIPEMIPPSLTMWWDQSNISSKELLAFRNKLFGGQPSSVTDSLSKVFSYLHQMNRTDKGVAMPESMVSQLSLSSWLISAINNGYRMDCGEFTWISHFMFNSLQLPNRGVKLSATNADWHTGEHYAIEVYLPWRQQWVLVDGLLDLYLPQDSSGNLLNSADIQQLMLSGSRLYEFQGLAIDGSNVHFKSLDAWYDKLKVYYANPRSHLNYWDVTQPMETNDFAGKLKRYATTYSSNVILSNRIKNDYFKIGVKLFAFYSFLLLSIGLPLIWFGSRRKI